MIHGIKTVPSETCKAQYALSNRVYWAFHISEGTAFKFSNLSFAYLHRFSHFISYFLYLRWEAERKITPGLYVGEGSENRAFRIFDPFLRPGRNLKSERVYFQTLLLHGMPRSLPCTHSFLEIFLFAIYRREAKLEKKRSDFRHFSV
jgi:hypothetical protein